MTGEQTRMADDFDMQSHDRTWHGFMRLITYSAVGIALLLILMALFLL